MCASANKWTRFPEKVGDKNENRPPSENRNDDHEILPIISLENTQQRKNKTKKSSSSSATTTITTTTTWMNDAWHLNWFWLGYFRPDFSPPSPSKRMYDIDYFLSLLIKLLVQWRNFTPPFEKVQTSEGSTDHFASRNLGFFERERERGTRSERWSKDFAWISSWERGFFYQKKKFCHLIKNNEVVVCYRNISGCDKLETEPYPVSSHL